MNMSRSHSDSEQSESVDAEESESNSSVSESSVTSSTSSTPEINELQADALELAEITGEVFRLPRGLCENEAIFREFFSEETWRMIPAHLQEQLQDHLPRFSHVLNPEEAYIEQLHTLRMLFNGELRFFEHSPLETLQRQLEEGTCRPDILKLRQSIAKSKRRESRFQTCERISRVAKELLISRERLLRIVSKSGPDTPICCERTQRIERPFSNLYDDTKLYSVRACKRFHREFNEIEKKLSIEGLSADEEDENWDISSGKLNQSDVQESLSGVEEFVKNVSSSTDKYIYGTFFKRRHGMDDDRAVQIDHRDQQMKLSNRNFRECLLKHKRRKLMEPVLPEFETSDIRLRDVYARAQMGGNFKTIFASGKALGRKLRLSKTNEPPALVPIQSGFNVNDNLITGNGNGNNFDHSTNGESKDNLFADTHSHLFKMQQNMGGYENEILADHEVFNIMDSEVELQQEEVQTYGASDETIPAFVISNEVVLSSTEDDKECSQNILYEEQQNDSLPTKLQKLEDSIMQVNQNRIDRVPKLEPISNANKSIKDKIIGAEKKMQPTKAIKNTLPAMATLTPLRKSPALNFAPPYIANAELIQETHACFFSLIRDFFCATPNHRMKFSELKKKTDVWLCNPITALNDWYSQAENWSSLLISAINFLAGDFKDQPDEYVPYIEFKTQLNIYQWIGAGRDSDARLSALCNYWMQRRNEMVNKTATQKHDAMMSLMHRRRSADIEDSSTYDSGVSPPPPPRYPTTWSVRAATNDEVAEFQRQERERFENPHRAYTYRMHGYESVVGPVKGIYSQIHALTKARGHSMMVGDRPNFVTILTLVRDATARLPNGEGTRADISELLKCSQYINRDAAENVLQTIVSGALDRMHTENDPCVRYDPKRKIWIYLHRNRSEEEFEHMHQQSQGLGKQKKQSTRKHKIKSVAKDESLANVDGGALGALGAESTHAMGAGNSTTTFSLPALVPANPIIVNSQTAITQNQQQKQQALVKCPPVPPLKYNIPNQHQKSLLKTALHPRQVEAQLKEVVADSSEQLPRSQARGITTVNATLMSGAGILNSTTAKQFTFPAPQARVAGQNFVSSAPIIVATPSGLQTVHVSNSSTLTSSTSSSLTVLKQSPQQKTGPLSATIGGKKVALNKPIIINQIAQQSPTKSKNLKQQQVQLAQHQGSHSFIIPISDGQRQAIFVENSQIITETSGTGSNSGAGTNSNIGPQQQQLQAKNIIRFVPSKNPAGVKSILSSPVMTSLQQIGAKQPVQIIGQRLINTAIRQPQLQQKGVGGITLGSNMVGSSVTQVNAANIIKLSPQAFNSLQQKQGQQIILKQSSNSPQQQRIVVGSTAAHGAQPTQTSNKNIILKQMPVSVSTQKFTGQNTISNIATSQSGTIGAPSVAKRIQTISTSSLTPQQQRVLLQNLKQQQTQQIQFKSVQVVGNSSVHQQQQAEQTQTTTKGQTMLTGSPRTITAASQGPQQQQQVKKTMATVVVSQPQVITRFLKTNPNTNNTQFSVSGTTNANKQAGPLKITGGSIGNQTQANNFIQLSTSSSSGQQESPTQYAVVPQAKNIITIGAGSRLITTQAGNTTALTSSVSGVQSRETTKTPNSVNINKILTTSGRQVQTLTVPQMAQARLLSKVSGATTTVSSASPVSNIRLINTNTASSFNIANKQVLFATKSASAVNTVTASQAHDLQGTGIIIGAQAVKLQGNINSKSGQTSAQPTSQMQTVIMGNQILRVQQIPHSMKVPQNRATVVSVGNTIPVTSVSNTNASATIANSDVMLNSSTSNFPKTLVIGSPGQTIRLQSAGPAQSKNIIASTSQQNAPVKSSPPSRVVLAVQGGGQIFLSPTFQGSPLNLKALQNVKMVSLGQTQVAKDTHVVDRKSTSVQAQKFSQQSMLKNPESNSNGSGSGSIA